MKPLIKVSKPRSRKVLRKLQSSLIISVVCVNIFRPSFAAPRISVYPSFHGDSGHKSAQSRQIQTKNPRLCQSAYRCPEKNEEYSHEECCRSRLRGGCLRTRKSVVAIHRLPVQSGARTVRADLHLQESRDLAQRLFHLRLFKWAPNTSHSASHLRRPRTLYSPFRRCLRKLVHSFRIQWFYGNLNVLVISAISRDLPDSNSRSVVVRRLGLDFSEDVCNRALATSLGSDDQNFQSIIHF